MEDFFSISHLYLYFRYVLDDTYILYKLDETVDQAQFFLECSRRRRGGCRFKAGIVFHDDGSHELSYMYSMDRHHCDQDGVEVVVQKFKSKIKETLAESHKAKYGQVI